MGLTNFPHGIFATPNLGGGMMTQGNIWFVKPYSGSDSNSGTTPDTAFKTLPYALSQATANQNDTIYMFQESNTASKTTDYQSLNLNWNKDGVHLIGVGAASNLYFGQRARIGALSTATSFANLFTLSANNCIVSGIEIFQGAGGTTLSAAQTGLTVSGMRNAILNCQIAGIGDTTLDYAGSNSLTVSGAENYFGSCAIGLDTVIRATSITETIISGTRNIFDKCIINSYTSGTTFKAINFAAGSYHTATWLNNCIISNALNRTGVVTTTGAINPPTAGCVYINGGGVFGYSAVSTSNSAYIQVCAPIAGAVKEGVGSNVLNA